MDSAVASDLSEVDGTFIEEEQRAVLKTFLGKKRLDFDQSLAKCCGAQLLSPLAPIGRLKLLLPGSDGCE